MGVAVIWGLAVATFLTLVVVPVMYSTLDPVKRALGLAFGTWWWRLLTTRKHLDFRGRARRAEFFCFVLVNGLMLSILDAVIVGAFRGPQLFVAVGAALTLLPTLAVAVRRMHDTGRRWWWWLVPGLNVVLCFMPGQRTENAYGPAPETGQMASAEEAPPEPAV
jgi:uncharacterized membrane protein YhaH (DUF805 family)